MDGLKGESCASSVERRRNVSPRPGKRHAAKSQSRCGWKGRREGRVSGGMARRRSGIRLPRGGFSFDMHMDECTDRARVSRTANAASCACAAPPLQDDVRMLLLSLNRMRRRARES